MEQKLVVLFNYLLPKFRCFSQAHKLRLMRVTLPPTEARIKAEKWVREGRSKWK